MMKIGRVRADDIARMEEFIPPFQSTKLAETKQFAFQALAIYILIERKTTQRNTIK